jgi:hypothetical protein
MGGEGSMAAANSSLKLNRSQLAKRKERMDKKGVDGSYSNVEMRKFPEATPEQLKLIREKIQLQNKKNRLKQLVLMFAIALFVSILFLILFQ